MPRPAYDKVQNSLLEACKKLFQENGIRDTEMQQIAVEAGISRSTLYRYITDKDQLVFMVATDLIFELVNRCLSHAMEPNANGLTKLRNFSYILAREIVSQPGLARFLTEFNLLYGSRQFDMPEARMYTEGMDKLMHREAQFLFEGLSDGSIRPMDEPMLFATILIHTIYGLSKLTITANLFSGSTYALPSERIIQNAVDILIDSIKA